MHSYSLHVDCETATLPREGEDLLHNVNNHSGALLWVMPNVTQIDCPLQHPISVNPTPHDVVVERHGNARKVEHYRIIRGEGRVHKEPCPDGVTDY
jgi:hypothetical protein